MIITTISVDEETRKLLSIIKIEDNFQNLNILLKEMIKIYKKKNDNASNSQL